MNPITKTIRIDLANPGGLDFLSRMYAVRGDSGSRKICFALYSGGEEYTPPSDITCQIAGIRPDGSVVPPYSTITQSGETRTAYSVSGNLLTVELSNTICKQAGDITVTISIAGSDGTRLSVWPVCCHIEQSAVAASEENPDLPSESASTAADRAEAASNQAAAFAAEAKDSRDSAETSAKKAADSQNAAESSAQIAKNSAEGAASSANAAKQSELNASNSASAASSNARTAAEKASGAESSAQAASQKAGEASSSAAAAADSQSAASDSAERAEAAARRAEQYGPESLVSSVNGLTGAVTLTAANLGAAPASHTHTAEQITGLPSVTVSTEDITAGETALASGAFYVVYE